MGLTNSSTGINAIDKNLNINKNEIIIGLAGNPNVGKSTVFNGLTGLKQHTGNWPGKTVSNATGSYTYKNKNFTLVDIPGTYSLMSNSEEEEIARDFICFGNPDTTIVVVDATCLERNLNLVLQTTEITDNVIVCVNLLDEAKRKGIMINFHKLSELLGVPVIGTSANKKIGLDILIDSVYDMTINNTKTSPLKIEYNNIIEQSISKISEVITPMLNKKINVRWTALKLIENDTSLLNSLKNYLEFDILENIQLQNALKDINKALNENSITIDNFKDNIVSTMVKKAEEISSLIQYRKL